VGETKSSIRYSLIESNDNESMHSPSMVVSKRSYSLGHRRGREYRNRKRRMFQIGPSKIASLVVLIYAAFSIAIKRNQTEYLRPDPVMSNIMEPPRVLKPSQFERKAYDVCIAGAGLSGAVIGERYASQQKKSVLIVEKRDHIGGNCYDEIDHETGLRVSKYGAHIFHTKSERVWEFVNAFSNWTKYEHEVVGVIQGKHVPIPVNIETVNTLFGLNMTGTNEMDDWLRREQVKFSQPIKNSEEMALSRVGRSLYGMIFQPYTIKQWGKHPRDLDPEVTARIPVRNDHDRRYFDDPHQALPSNGYTAFFQTMLDNPNIEVQLNTDYFDMKDFIECGKTYFTGPIDVYFDYLGLEKLEYRSLDFERKVLKNVAHFQPKVRNNVFYLFTPLQDLIRIIHSQL
jgi:UDP-galactopyranose mutase